MIQESEDIVVRAIYRAVSIGGLSAPHNVAHLKIHYPATLTNSQLERNTGMVAASVESALFPVVIMMPGINVGPDAYSWLAKELAKNNIVTVTYSLVAEEMPGYIGITPGLNLSQLRPDTYGKAPSGNAIGPIIEELKQVQEAGPLEGKLNTNNIILGGHSAGGTTALLNANPDWFPQLAAVFTYGAHSGASTALGFAENTTLSINNSLPILLIGGTEDGCIASSHQRYSRSENSLNITASDQHVAYYNDATARIEQTFSESISGGDHDKHLILLSGANHFSIAHPIDTTTGRHFIDRPTTQADSLLRDCLSTLIIGFINQYALDNQSSDDGLAAIIGHHQALIPVHRCK